MVLISKEDFVNAITDIQEELKRREEFDEAIGKINDSFFVCTIGEKWLNLSLKLLSAAVGDKGDKYGTMLEWYLFEDVDKQVSFSPNSKYNPSNEELVVDCSTPERLYDYFVKYGD